jgi:two-component system sensor histidine kinase KdpD
MLDEAVRRKSRGQDVVIASLELTGRAQTDQLAEGFERIPPIPWQAGTENKYDLNLAAILARKPQLVIVDMLAHSNRPGAEFESRAQEVRHLMENGIGVLTSLNVWHLESLNDHVADITGIRIRETVPDYVLHDADEVEIIDLPPQALINRIQRGDVFGPDGVPAEHADLYREGNLNALREIALREAATAVDEDLNEYRREKRIEKPWATQDRVMICISPTRSSLRLIRRGWRMGQRMHGEVIAVHVEDGTSNNEAARKILDEDFKLARRLGLETVILKGELGPTLVDFARKRNVTAVILGHPERSRLQEIFKPSILSELARELRTVDIIVVSTEVPTEEH